MYLGKENRTSEWLSKVKGLISRDLADEVDNVLKATADSYEYEKIAYPEGEKSLKDRILDWFSYSYRRLDSVQIREMILKETQNSITYELLSDRAKKELDLVDRLYSIEEMTRGTQEDAKRIEKALFDDDGSYFREIFRKIAGGDA